MIKTWKLFRFPICTSFLAALFPFGTVVWLGLVALWYMTAHNDVDLWLDGKVYRKDEYADSEELR